MSGLARAMEAVTRAPVRFICIVSALGGLCAFVLAPYLLRTFLIDEGLQGESRPLQIMWTGVWMLASGLLATAVVLSLNIAHDARVQAAQGGRQFFWLFVTRSWISILPLLPILYVAPLLDPSVYGPRESEVRMHCANNIKSICLALHEYREKFGRLPPAVVKDPAGRPLHSWRVLVLPYLGVEELYTQYDFAEPWDGPHNRQLFDKMPRVYRCPAELRSECSITSYLLLTGKETLFEGDKPPPLLEPADQAKTVMIVESANSGTIWSQPQDLDLEGLGTFLKDGVLPAGRSRHGHGVYIGLADGSAHFISPRNPPEELSPKIPRK